MDKITFKSFCVEFFSEYKNLKSNYVCEIFEGENVFDFIDGSFDELKELCIGDILKTIDDFLKNKNIYHNLKTSNTVSNIIRLISDKYIVDENTAFSMFYSSEIGKKFSDNSSELSKSNCEFIFSLFEKEIGEKECIA